MTYTAKDVINLLGISKSMYNAWVHRGFLICTLKSYRRGISSQYTRDDMIRNLVFMELVQCGFQQIRASEIASEIEFSSEYMIAWVGNFSRIHIDMDNIAEILEIFDEA